jgi:formylglycine-generating enzyme
VSDFRLDRFEVTVGRFRRFVEAYPGSKPAPGAGAHPRIQGSGWDKSWNGQLPATQAALVAAMKCNSGYETWTDTAGANESLPMNCIDWLTGFAFCAWDGGRLPTEAEWNYAAAGGGEQRSHPWLSPSMSQGIDATYAVYGCLGYGDPKCGFGDILPPGSRSPRGDGKWGQADMAGSMWELTLDENTELRAHEACNDCANISFAAVRVVRGGGWALGASNFLTSGRYGGTPIYRSSDMGARCARTF